LNKKIIIAIDGFSSTGKSTLAKMLSRHLSYMHINTGAMYRAVTLNAIRNYWIEFKNNEFFIKRNNIISSLHKLSLEFRVSQNNDYKMYMNNEDVENLIKTEKVSKYVSEISKDGYLRDEIVFLQREIGKNGGVVMEGRDIGSVVFPDAEVKLFITASLEVRARRRYEELIKLGIAANFDNILKNLDMRDSVDSSREKSPLLKVDDAILIDNTSLNLSDQFNLVLGILKDKKIIL
jgi:cytidylate kinase